MEQDSGIGKSSADAARFDEFTQNIPDEIGGAAVDASPAAAAPDILPPLGDEANGWPVWDIQQIAGFPFFYLSQRFGEQWELSEKESERLAVAWKPLLDRWFPLDDTPLGTALLITLAVVGPRLVATDWSQPIARANTRTAASGGSRASSASAKAASQPEWDVFSNGSPV